jgi:hypothetical protein
MGERRVLIGRAATAEARVELLTAQLAAAEGRIAILLANQQSMAAGDMRGDPDWPGSRL